MVMEMGWPGTVPPGSASDLARSFFLEELVNIFPSPTTCKIRGKINLSPFCVIQTSVSNLL
jgi:hypothetical protein